MWPSLSLLLLLLLLGASRASTMSRFTRRKHPATSTMLPSRLTDRVEWFLSCTIAHKMPFRSCHNNVSANRHYINKIERVKLALSTRKKRIGETMNLKKVCAYVWWHSSSTDINWHRLVRQSKPLFLWKKSYKKTKVRNIHRSSGPKLRHLTQ